MRINHEKNIWKIVLAVLLTICVFLAFGLFIRGNNLRATAISVKSLRDSTIQSAERIDDILERSRHEIFLTASMYEEMLEDGVVSSDDLKLLSETSTFDYVEFTNADGIDLNADDKTANVSDREYFQKGMQGESGISVTFNSKITNENLVSFYTPMYNDGEIIGVLAGCYREETMEKILYSTFFDESSRTFLCMSDGTIISRCNDEVNTKSIFDYGNFNGELEQNVKDELRSALLSGDDYEFQYEGKRGTGNAYAIALDGNDWVLIQTFPSQVTAQFVNDANRAGVILLIELIGIFAVCLIIILVVSSVRKKKLVLENIEKSYIIDGITQRFKTFVLVNLEEGTYKYLAGCKPYNSSIPTEGDYNILKQFIINGLEDDDGTIDQLFSREGLRKNFDKDTSYLRYEYRSKRNKGRWNGYNLICLKRVDDVPVELLFTYQDVTKIKEGEQKSYEALKEAYHAVEVANMAKSDFLSSMSHDIRTPMNAIMGMTAIAAMNIDKPERVKDCLNKITVSSQHLLGLINEVLDMSKIESGKLVFTEGEFNLSDVVENIVSMFLPQTKAKNQEFKVNIADIAHEEVIGDSMRLQQIFVNIIGNAVKFTDDGGKITLSISEKPSGMQGCGCYVFTFEDNGIGMDEEFIKHIFEPFARAGDSRTHKIEGTGLGMPIVKNLVQMMNGDIKIESKLNEGSKFIVTVYLKLNSSKHDDVSALEKLKVLVADDDRFACESACAVLTEIGMTADGVFSGQEAVDKLLKAHGEKHDYSAVILDWKMPEMDGVETARVIREKIDDEVPIIILSAFDYSEIEEEARAAGVNAFITKPLFRSRLVYVMKSLMHTFDEDEQTELDELRSKNYSGKRVLLVEDNEINMEIAEELLTQAGVEVDKAFNGQLAVERVNEMPPGYYNMIFMDIQMPVMNGYDATAAIRASEREDLKSLPIVAMSADVFMDDIKHAHEVGMNGHVAKPVEIENLLKALEEWI